MLGTLIVRAPSGKKAGKCVRTRRTRAAVCQHCWLLHWPLGTRDAVCQCCWLLLGAAGTRAAVCQHCWLLHGEVVGSDLFAYGMDIYICIYVCIYIFIYLSQKDMKTTNRISPRVHIGHGKVVGSNLFAYGMEKNTYIYI